MVEKFLIEEYRERLGEKVGTWNFPHGKETFAINVYENGFVLRKRGQVMVLDIFGLDCLKDIYNKFSVKRKVVESLN